MNRINKRVTGIGMLLAVLLVGIGHQKTVKNVGRFVHGDRNGPCGEGFELNGDVGVGFQLGFMAVTGVDKGPFKTLG